MGSFALLMTTNCLQGTFEEDEFATAEKGVGNPTLPACYLSVLIVHCIGVCMTIATTQSTLGRSGSTHTLPFTYKTERLYMYP